MNKIFQKVNPSAMKPTLALSLLAAAALLLSACRALPAAPTAAPLEPSPTAAPPTALPRPTQAPSPTPSATPDPNAAPTAAAQSYAEALEKGDTTAAAGMLSEFSLTYANLTRGEAAAQLAANPASYTLLETSLLNENTALVGVRVSPADGSTAREETWVFRQENGRWLCNYANLIDTLSLDVEAQTTNGVTLKPRLLVRYSDHIRLEMLAQNQSGDVVVLGQPNEILATFHFGAETVEAEPVRIILEPKRSYPNAAIEVKGSFSAFPASVDIRTWKNYQTAPWFTFDLTR